MKKSILIVFAILLGYAGYAQDVRDTYYDGVESSKDLSVSSDQRRRIIAIKKTIGRRHAEIGKSGLRGYEKGEAHRKLNMQIRSEINDILNEGQRASWSQRKDQSYDSFNDIERKIDVLEDEIDDLEDYYDKKIDRLEDDNSLSKADRKYKKKQLKAERDAKKDELKRQIKSLKDSRFY